jgi:hypothetical protein
MAIVDRTACQATAPTSNCSLASNEFTPSNNSWSGEIARSEGGRDFSSTPLNLVASSLKKIAFNKKSIDAPHFQDSNTPLKIKTQINNVIGSEAHCWEAESVNKMSVSKGQSRPDKGGIHSSQLVMRM